MIPSFAISLISEATKKGTGKDWNKEWTSPKPREVQLGQDQMEGPNDTESAGLSQRRKLSRLQKDCTDQGWVTPGTGNSIRSEAGRLLTSRSGATSRFALRSVGLFRKAVSFLLRILPFPTCSLHSPCPVWLGLLCGVKVKQGQSVG